MCISNKRAAMSSSRGTRAFNSFSCSDLFHDMWATRYLKKAVSEGVSGAWKAGAERLLGSDLCFALLFFFSPQSCGTPFQR